MSTRKKLYLHEEIMLLVLKDEEGTMTPRTKILYAIAGAIIADLLINGRIIIEDDKKIVSVTNTKSLRNPLLDMCLEKIKARKKPDSLLNWIFHLTDQQYKHIIAEQLSKRGILRVDEDKVFLIFNRKIYPEVNPIPEEELKKRMKEAFISDPESADPRDLFLLSLAHIADILDKKFKRNELSIRMGRIKTIEYGYLSENGLTEVVKAAQAAISGMRDESLRTIKFPTTFRPN